MELKKIIFSFSFILFISKGYGQGGDSTLKDNFILSKKNNSEKQYQICQRDWIDCVLKKGSPIEGEFLGVKGDSICIATIPFYDGSETRGNISYASVYVNMKNIYRIMTAGPKAPEAGGDTPNLIPHHSHSLGEVCVGFAAETLIDFFALFIVESAKDISKTRSFDMYKWAIKN